MTQLERQRRKKVISFIEEGGNQSLIDEVYRLLEIEFEDEPYVTSEAQKRAIAVGERDIAEGNSYSEEEAEEEMTRWLKE